MWEFVKKEIYSLKKVAGVELVLMPDGTKNFYGVILTQKKGTVQKDTSWFDLKTVDDLKQKLPVSIPVSLIINGKGILFKKTKADLDYNFSDFFPSLNENEFFFTETTIEKNRAITIIKRALLETLVMDFVNAGYKILSVSIGPENILPLVTLLRKEPVTLDTAGFNYTIDNNIVSEVTQKAGERLYEVNASELGVGNLYVSSVCAVSLGAALKLLSFGINQEDGIETNIVFEQRNQYKNYLTYKACKIGFVSGLFILLLLNFIIYSYYFNLNEKAAYTSQLINSKQTQQQGIEKDLLAKENFIQSSGWFDRPCKSYLADRIASMMPDDVILTSMNIDPSYSTRALENNIMQFKSDTVLITGNCENPSSLNTFISRIKSLEEIRQVFIRKFSGEKADNPGAFAIDVFIKE